VFGLGIRNELGKSELFGVRVKYSTSDGAALANGNDWIQMFDGISRPFGGGPGAQNWIIIRNPPKDGIDIDINDKVKIPIGIKVGSSAVSGTTYVFDVEVWNDGEDSSNDDPFEVDDSMYSSPLKLYVEIP
jgi:hypothetical protein